MLIEPMAEGCKGLGHSWPSVHWWLSLAAADQGAWIAGLGAFAAAVVALVISDKDRRRRERERGAKARICAAYITTDMQRLSDFVVRLRKNLQSIDIANQAQGYAIQIFAIEQSLVEVRAVLERVDLKLLLMLPPKIGEGLATGIGSLPLCCDAISLVVFKMKNGDELIMQKPENFSVPADMLKSPMASLAVFFKWHGSEFPDARGGVSSPAMKRISI